LTVTFSSNGSGDPDGDGVIDRKWNFGEGGHSTDSAPTHVFTKPGCHRVTLQVRTANGLTAEDEVTVIVGNEPPHVTFSSPKNQTFYWPGRPLEYAVVVADREDGENLTPDEVTLELRKAGGSRPVDHGIPATDSALMTLDCRACHVATGKAVGPSYAAIALRYRGTEGAVKRLAEKVIAGGAGIWGDIPMAAHPQLSMGEAEDVVREIFALSDVPDIRAIPSQGTLTLAPRALEDPRARFVLQASYEDRGAASAGAQTGHAVVELRHPRIPAAFADTHVGYDRFRDSLSGGKNPSHLLFRDIDLTGVTSLDCEYVAPDKDGLIELRLDSYAGRLIATSPIQPTGSWDNSAVATLTWPDQIAGRHDIYLIVLRKDPSGGSVAVVRSVTFNAREESLR
jgi:cytochrome c